MGRDQERSLIDAFLESRSDGPAVLVLEGDPGIGMTALWSWGVERARELDLCVLTASPVEAETKLSLSTLGDLLGDALEGVVETLPEPQRRALEIALLIGDGDEPADPRTLGVAVINSLAALAESRRVLLAIDDVQWVDPASDMVLGFVVRRLQSNAVTLLLAERRAAPVQEAGPFQLSRRALGDAVSTVEVGPLSLGALHHLLHHRLGLVLTRPKLRRLHELCAGNAFYGLELGRAVQRGTIDLRPGDSLPDTLRTLVGARLALLPAETRSALLAAAAVSEPTCELVARVVGGDVMAKLQPALEADVVEIQDGRIRFSHPLLASGVYGAAAEAKHRALHRRLAVFAPDLEERARHVALAADGPDENAADALDRAALGAHRRGAVGAAAELSELARQLTPDGRADAWYERTVRAALYTFEAGETARAQDLFESALSAARSGAQRGYALYQLGVLQEYWGDRRRAVELYRTGLEERDEDDLLLRAGLEQGLGSALFLLREDLAEAAEHARIGVTLAEEAGNSPMLSITLGVRGLIEVVLGLEEWRATMQTGVDLDEDGDPAPIAEGAPFSLAAALIWVDEFDEARAICQSLLERERVEDSGLPWVLAELALANYYLGNWAEAGSQADDAIDIAAQTSQEPQRLLALSARALVRTAQGEIEGARADCQAVVRAADEHGVMAAAIVAASAQGLLGILSGRVEDAHAALAPLVDRLERGGVREPGSTRFVADEIEVLVGLDRLEEAEALLDRVEGRARKLDRASMRAAFLRCRGLLAAARDDLDGAFAALEQALGQHDRVPMPFERARTLLALGSLQRRARQRRRARETLQHALALFEELGAELLAASTRAELGRMGGRAPSAGELTPTEQRIADLVAEGKSNKEVAAVLVVSVHTVEAALTSIYRKLDVHSRTEMARKLAESGVVR